MTHGQFHEWVARSSHGIDPTQVPGDFFQNHVLNLPDHELGRRLEAFLKHGCRVPLEQTPRLIMLGDSLDWAGHYSGVGATAQIWLGATGGRGDQGEPANFEPASLKSIDSGEVLFEPACPEDKKVKGEEKLGGLRFESKPNILLGGRACAALWADYQLDPRTSILEWLRRTKNIRKIDFFGLVLQLSGGGRTVLSLESGIGGWLKTYRHLRETWTMNRIIPMLKA